MSAVQPTNNTTEEEDPFYSVIEKTGCSQFHFKLQDCYDNNKDWKSCSVEMEEFKLCMDRNKLKK